MTPLLQAKALNITLIERKTELTLEEENGILHKAGGPYAGFVINKPPLHAVEELETCHLSFKLNVYMKHVELEQIQQV